MKPEKSHIAHIGKAFNQMRSTQDFLDLLNFAKPLVYGDEVRPFELKHISWYLNPKLGRKKYNQFHIKKKSGAERTIHAPAKGLKTLQKTLNFILNCVFEPHSAAFGFVPGKSIVDNANIHVGSRYVYNIDLKDFFPSIDQARVWKCLQLKPFNLHNNISTQLVIANEDTSQSENLNALDSLSTDNNKVSDERNSTEHKIIDSAAIKDNNRLKIANIISSICCTEMEVERKNENGQWQKVLRNVLPQGAPTSPVITNIVCQRLDFLLTGVAKRFGLKYSRYADDITFSSMHNVYQTESEFLIELHRIIAEQNFHIKESKTRLQKDGYRKEVTGLLVNEKANVQKRYIKQLRMWLYYWERYGYERASGFFLQHYISDKGHIKNGTPDMLNVISGKLDYLKMVKGANNVLYLKFNARFEKITGKVSYKSINLIEDEEAEKNYKPLTKVLLGEKKLPNVFPDDKIVDNPIDAKNEENKIPVFHKPNELVALLKKFSVNDSALKYTTHSWDAGRDAHIFKDLSEFLSIAKSEYSQFSYKLKELSANLHGKIYNFLFNEKIDKSGWGDKSPDKRIYFGWSSPQLLEACKTDISLNPEDYILPEQFQIQRAGKTLQKFKHIIDVFKNEIEVRDENSALLNLILQKHDHHLISFSPPKISNLENKTFYTDIQWLSKALDLIFKGIQDRSQHQIVEYFVAENNSEKITLNILHRNSFKKGVSIYDDKLNLTRGDFGPIKNYLMNLCDWSIESIFHEGAYRINYLVSDNNIPAYEKIKSAEGFKHILTFYK